MNSVNKLPAIYRNNNKVITEKMNKCIKYYKQWNKIIQLVWLKLMTKRRVKKNKENNLQMDGILRICFAEGLIDEIDEKNQINEITNITPNKQKESINNVSFKLNTDFLSDDLFEAFYLDNKPSPLSEINTSKTYNKQETTYDYSSNSDDLNSDEIVEQLTSLSPPNPFNKTNQFSSPIHYDNIDTSAYNISPSPYTPSPHSIYNYGNCVHNKKFDYLGYSPYAPYISQFFFRQQTHNNHNKQEQKSNDIQNHNSERHAKIHSERIRYTKREMDSKIHSDTKTKVGDFSKMRIEKILQLPLTLTELIEYDLLRRLITDQSGSRFLQNLLNSNNESDFALLLNHLVNKLDLTFLSEDRYGNYSVQILFQKGNFEQHKQLLNSFMCKNILRLSKSEYGCRVIQKALKCVSNNGLLIQLVNNLENQTTDIDNDNKLHFCLINSNANHVLQAILNLTLPFDTIKFIKYALEENLCFYCQHVFACRVVQCFIKQYGDKLSLNKLFYNNSHLQLSSSMYGNYVIQCIIDGDKWYSNLNGINKFRWKLTTELFNEETLLYLSTDQYGSNVIESCIKVATEKQISSLIKILCARDFLNRMIRHCFGNYVVKTTLKNSNHKQQKQLIKCIEKLTSNINFTNSTAVKYTEILLNEVNKIKNMNNESGIANINQETKIPPRFPRNKYHYTSSNRYRPKYNY